MDAQKSGGRSQAGSPRSTRSLLTFSRNWLKHVANETLDIAHQGYYTNRHGQVVSIKDSLTKAIQQSVHYHCSHVFSPPPPTTESALYDTKFYVCYGSSLDIAALLHQTNDDDDSVHVGILNSASSKTPSKFLRGTLSQEECICRASLLYSCLVQFEHRPHYFYEVNNKPKYQASSSACAIFSPNVPIIRKDSPVGELLDDYQECCFVSICAPNAFVVGADDDEGDSGSDEGRRSSIPKAARPGSNETEGQYELITLKEALRDRLFRALSMFCIHGCTDLVLCAFGCGVHGNQPDMVASIFRELLLDNEFRGRFQRVVFAIHSERTGNFVTFQKAFPEAETELQLR